MADEYEQRNVHDVYQEIAGHFSATRFKVSDETNPTPTGLNKSLELIYIQ